MAFNLQTFKTRALTALLFVVVMLVGLLWNFWSFLVLFTVIHFGCWFEYLKLVEKVYDTKIDIVIKWFFAICGFTLVLVFGLRHESHEFFFTPSVANFSIKINIKWAFWILLIICLLVFLFQNKQIPVKAKRMSFAGLIYISLSIAFLLNLRDSGLMSYDGIFFFDIGVFYSLIIIFSIWINDTMAYFVGSFIGKTPLTKISPKKTWEGTVGGALLAIIVIGFSAKFILSSFLEYHFPGVLISPNYSMCFIIPALCAIFGTLGDLLESKLKRMANVKDSGSFMPGHGGFLDRFDSLLVAVPAVWVFVYFFIK